MSHPEQITVRNPDGTWTLDMWGVSYAAPMNDLRKHPPMALFFHVDAATDDVDRLRRDAAYVGRVFSPLDVRLLRVTVGPWVEPPYQPARGQRVRGVDAEGVEWEAPYLRAADMSGHWLGAGLNRVRVVSVHPLGPR